MLSDENPPQGNRFDKVDILTLLDPDWIERSQASRLVEMATQSFDCDCEAESLCSHVDFLVA